MRSLRMRASSRSPPTMRPNRNSSSSTLVELAAGVRGVQRRLDRQRARPRRPGRSGATSAAGPRSRPGRAAVADTLRRRTAGGPAPARSSGLPAGSDSARRSVELAVEQPGDGEQLVGQRRAARRPAAAAAARDLLRRPGARAPGRAPPGWRPPSAGAPGASAVAVEAAMPSSSARNRSTVPLRRASSARDSPTTRPARSTASAPIWPRSSLTTCWRWLASCSSPRATIRADSSCAWVAQLLEDLLPLGAGLVADLRGLVAGLGQLRAVLLQRGLGLGLHRLGPLDAALDRLAAGPEDLLEARRDELREHEAARSRRRSMPMMISPSGGISGLCCLRSKDVHAVSSLSRSGGPCRSGTGSGAEDEGDDEADQRQRLGERDAEEGVGTGEAGRLGLPGGRLDVGGPDDADTDTGADRGEAVADRADAAGRALPERPLRGVPPVSVARVVPGGWRGGAGGAVGVVQCGSVLGLDRPVEVGAPSAR